MSRQHSRGATLIETVIALFLLGLSTILVATLFQSGLQRARLSEQERVAINVANNALAELRAWSKAGNYVSPSDLSSKDGSTYSEPANPEFVVTYKVKQTEVLSSCSQLENTFPAAQRRALSRSVAFVEARVDWSSNSGPRSLSLESLLPESPRTLSRVIVNNGNGGTIPKDRSVSVTAVAVDDQGRRIEDLFVDWFVEPIDGRGSLLAERAQPRVTLSNEVDDGFGGTTYYPGRCRIGARVRYGQVEVIGYSGEFILLP